MNRKIKFIIYSITVFIFVSCSEEFLEKHPLDKLSSANFWETEQDARMALTGVYSRLLNDTYNWRRTRWDVLSGNVCMRGGGAFTKLSLGIIESTSGGMISQAYENCYKGISACNIFLDNVDNVTIDESLKNQYKAEVLFLRALHYFTLVEFYGGVPVYTKPPTIEEAKIKQSTKEEVTELILSDLEFAVNNLPNVVYDGHAVKGSALALKAKVLLHNERWEEAAATANQIIQDGIFSLYDNYPNLFLTVGQNNNPEIIFSTRYLNPDVYTHMSGYDISNGYEGNYFPTQDFVDCFECIDGLPISSSPLYNPEEDFRKNRDPRLDYSVRLASEPIVSSSGVEGLGADASTTGYRGKKYLNPEILPWSYSIRSDQDHILLRYAGVLLMYAEAKNEIDGPDESVYNAINAVRAREGVNMPPLPDGLSKSEMRERIMNERRVEFGLEGMRYFDLRRWKTAETVLPQLTEPQSGLPLVFEAPKHYLFPFPESELLKNPNLVQNPGY